MNYGGRLEYGFDTRENRDYFVAQSNIRIAMKNNNRIGTASLVLLLPSATLVFSGLLGFNVPKLLISPLLVLAGLLAALLINLLSVLHLQAERDTAGDVAALTVRIGLKSLNLAVIGLSSLLLGVIVAYAFVENFQPR